MRRKYAIIGTGALGGFYGARLQRAGCEVHFLLRSDYEHVREHGLVCESKDGDFVLPKVNAYRDVREMPECDVVIVALKTTQNHLLKELLPPLMNGNAFVLLMQNGLGGEELLADIVGKDRVIGGLCFLCSNKIGPGHIHHVDYGLVTLGDFSTHGITPRVKAVANDLAAAGIPTQLVEDLAMGRWQKLIWNIPYNGLSVILDSTTDALMNFSATRQLCEASMWEVVADARVCGVQIPDEAVPKMLDYTDKMKPYRTSMKIDFDERRPMEVEAIFGNPLRAAKKAGAKSPILETMYAQLKFIDAKNVM